MSETERLFADGVAERLRAAGFGQVEPLSSAYDAENFGDANAVFRVGSVLLRVVRDRGDEFMELAASASPDKFFQFADLEVAFGWSSTADVIAKEKPMPLETVLASIRFHEREIEAAFAGPAERLTRARLERAVRSRERAMLARYQAIKPGTT